MNLPVRDSALALLFVSLACASCATSNSETAAAPGVDIAAYATFGWQTADGAPVGSQPPAAIQEANFHNAIRKQLIEKGYSEVETNPDFRISYQTESYTTEKKSSPVRIGVGVGSWTGPVGGGVGTSVPVGGERVTALREVRLTIRAVDPKTQREVWVGTTADGLGQGLDEGTVGKAVAGTMKKFPARRK